MALRRLAPVALALLALIACGRARTAPPDVSTPRLGEGTTTLDLPSAGLTLRIPRGWPQAQAHPPRLASLGSGGANVAIWRYPRTEPLPTDPAALARARTALVARAKERDPSLVLTSARIVRVDGAPAVELVASEHVGTVRRRVRSTHVYASGAEIVIDALAPPAEFARLDRAVFAPLVASVRLSAPER